MCRFSAPVRHVASTRIYARLLGDTQILVYEMQVDTSTDNAMILPVPTPPDSDAGAMTWIDLSSIPNVLRIMESVTASDHGGSQPRARSGARGPLPVVNVGSFEASFVPSLDDLDRLDRRFRLGDGLRQSLARAPDWGIAVFQLAAGNRRIHPMGMRFPTCLTDRCYFPTVHVHDGEEPPVAMYDHVLFAQSPFDPERTSAHNTLSPSAFDGWQEHRLRGRPAPYHMVDEMRAAHAAEIIDLDAPLYRADIHGLARNIDVFLIGERLEE